MVKGKILLLALMTCCCLNNSHAQSDYTFTPFTASDALVSSEIITLFQDAHHFLWIGHTGGVSRYDGYQLEDFLFTSTKQLGKAYTIAEDSAHNIWIGTETGLFLFAARQLHYISCGKMERPVYALAFDKAGGLWIGNSDGPSYIRKEIVQQTIASHELPLHQYNLPAWKKYHPLKNLAVFISLGKDDTPYFGDGYEVFKYTDEQILPVWKNDGRHDQLKGIVAVNKDTVYICSGANGPQAVENGVRRLSPAVMGISNAFIEKNGILFCYTTEGIYTVNRHTLVGEKVLALPDHMLEWGSCFLQDNEKNFWIGTHEHLGYARKNFFTILREPALDGFNELYTVNTLHDGSIICGGNLGATFRLNKDASAFTPWKKIFPRAPVTAIFQEQPDKAWFSSWYQGIALLEKEKLQIFTKAGGLRDNTNFIFLENNRGELFAAGDDGVTKILKDEQGKVRFRNYQFYTGSTDYVIINSGVPAPEGSLLFGSNRGLLVLSKDTLVRTSIKNAGQRNLNITDMRRDASGNIWISTIGDGILVCSFQRGDTLVLKEQLTKEHGLPSLAYLQLLIDRDNIVWAAGYNGITRIETTRDNQFFLSTFGKNQGFLPERFHTIRMKQDATGIIWVATSSGLLKFDPAAIDRAMYPALVLNGITLSGQKDSSAGMQNGTRLPFQSNSLSFRYTGIYFSDPSAVQYAYRLAGLDSNWIAAGTDQQADFQHLSPGNYSFEVKAAAGTNRWSKIVSYDFTIEPPFWQRWWFIAAVGLTILGIIYAINRKWIRNIRKRAEEKSSIQQQIAENKQKATEARLQSMRLQMNPHFLFNALNSIQQMILAGDETVATRCLSKFSRLLRLVLIHSDKEKVTLREELETLQLYVDIESLRFKDRFEYYITCNTAIDQDETMIPTLLIQPFVENAIWHGLMHKEGQRRLQIHFTEEGNDMLVCVIEDNGIGRKASRSIRENSSHENKHTGKGITIAAERLKIFGERSDSGCSLDITDMQDNQGNPEGTRVMIKFPA